ncbi:hypothetical protein MLD38_018357 [Melastoma candidum]|uniref:Uncharacterized protein n=2 Tax=Melastoma candidum TaxID=119954 RepID=A0ACB9QWQ9_9MYRT|nr:hypothetical protein MLD38_018357 [Melastoma candidum]
MNSLTKPHRILRLPFSTAGAAIAHHFDQSPFATQEERSPNSSHELTALFQLNTLLKDLINRGHLPDARKVFDRMVRRDEISWTTMVSGYVAARDVSEALSLVSAMWVDPDIAIDAFLLSVALKACAVEGDVALGGSMHGYAVKTVLVDSVFVGSALLDMYMKCGSIGLGCAVFDEMTLKNVVSWTAVITGLVRGGYCRDALRYFSEMWWSKVHCDTYTYAIALKACGDLGNLNYGREIHVHCIKKGFDGSSFVINTLASMYNKCGKLNFGLEMFERTLTKDVVSWTSLITAYVQNGQEDSAIEAFSSMRKFEVCPNEYTFAAVISACANLSRIDWGQQLHAYVLKNGLLDFLSVANSTMTLYSKCGQLSLATIIFHEAGVRDVISWSTMIAGYSQSGCSEKAFWFLALMRREGPRPTEFALASVLSVCGSTAILDSGKQLHAHVFFIGLENSAMVQSALINMYAKCGSIQEASKVFDTGIKDDIVSWTVMINGYAEHGLSRAAINLFEGLPLVGLQPDSVTYIGVLAACSHAGLVDLGFHYFDTMNKCYHIMPTKEHYGCMIDLLCRAGRLTEAEQMIESMPFECDDVVLSTLLRACRISGDVDRGRRSAEQILDLDPKCAGTHITLANLYSARGKWKEAADMRKEMRSKQVIKEPGWSWIKVKDSVFTFVAGAETPFQSEELDSTLKLLALRETDIKEDDSLLIF